MQDGQSQMPARPPLGLERFFYEVSEMAARKHLGSIRARACGVRRPRERHVAATRLTVRAEHSFSRRDPENCTRGRAAVSRVPRQRGLAMRSPDLSRNRCLSLRFSEGIF
jgi:hypothetical protein